VRRFVEPVAFVRVTTVASCLVCLPSRHILTLDLRPSRPLILQAALILPQRRNKAQRFNRLCRLRVNRALTGLAKCENEPFSNENQGFITAFEAKQLTKR
jgi:hypothetical protein